MAPSPRSRSRDPADLLARLTPLEREPALRDLVKRPTPAAFARVQRESPEERLRYAFAMTAFAERFRGRAHAARS